MSSLYIVIPAYNESENIEKTIDQWYPVVERHNDEGNSRLVIINDGSKDNTYELLQKCAATRPLLVPLDKPNGGHGPTVLYGYRYAIRQKAEAEHGGPASKCCNFFTICRQIHRNRQ